MTRSYSDLIDFKAIGIVLALLIPTNFALTSLTSHSSASLSQTEFVDHSTRREHATELLGAKAAKLAGADHYWVPGAMEAYIVEQLDKSLPEEDRARAGEIADAILREAKAHDFDPIFIMAIIQRESRYNPRAVGSHGEIGMMQIKPSTARWISEKFGLRFKAEESLYDPVVNIRISTTYLAHLRQSFKKNSSYYVAAYNMGPGRARAMMNENIVPEVYSRDVLSNYLSYYRKIEPGKKIAGRFSISMVQAPRKLAFSQISN